MDSPRRLQSVRTWRGIVVLAGVCFFSRASSAAVFYVRAGGNDGANGLSPATAFATIGHAAAALQNPGDQVMVGPGTYAEGDIAPARSGIVGHPMQFLADSSGLVTGDAAGPVVVMPPANTPQTTGFLLLGRHDVVIDGFTVVGAADAGVQVRAAADGSANSSNVTVRNVLVSNSVKRGIDITATGAVVIENTTATNNGSGGITIQGCVSPSPLCRAGASAPVTPSVVNNSVIMNGAEGISLTDSEDGSIEQNDVHDNGATGILVRSSSDLAITNNTLDGNYDDGIGVGTGSAPGVLGTNLSLTGNTVQGTSNAGINIVATGLITVQQNTVTGSGTAGVSVIGDGAMHIALTNNAVQENAQTGVFVSGASGGTIADNTVANTGADALVVRQSSTLSILRNRVSDNAGNGVAVGIAGQPAGGNFEFTDNDVERNIKAGITAFVSGPVQVVTNVVLHSGSTGMSIQGAGGAVVPTVSNNVVGTSGAHGIFLGGVTGGVVQNNISFSNGDTGLTLRSAFQVLVANNLVYANATDGVALGTADLVAANVSVVNNTVYGNGGWGLVIGTSVTASGGALVVNNIFNRNRNGGITIARPSVCGYVAGFNIDTDGYGQKTPSNSYDVTVDPLFVEPAGADGVLGGDGFADDDFHLQQLRGGQRQNSPGVDAGSAAVADMGLIGSTAEGGALDVGVVDIGYHYGAAATRNLSVPTPYMPLFVRAHGDDGNSGLDPQHALATIQEAAHRGEAGTTVVVGPGRYFEGEIHPIEYGGSTAFFADAAGTVTGDLPGVVIIDASGADTGFVILNACNVAVDGFYVTGSATAGIQVRAGSDGASIRNNVVFSNQRLGVEIFGADAGEIRNNLVYANGTGGIEVSTSRGSQVVNNTSYGNEADGLLIGGVTDAEAAPDASVLRNIVAGNGKGVKVTPAASFAGYVSGFNIVPDGFAANTPQADSDFTSDPLLANPAGADGMLGGAGFLDDDFHVLQDGEAMSPAVDVDFSEMNSLADGSTSSDGRPDVGPLDAGYHYAFLPRTPVVKPAPRIVYVRAGGSDANAGDSPLTALASVANALTLVAGDGMVVMGPGTYHESAIKLGNQNGGQALPVLLGDPAGVLTGDPAGAVVLDSGGRSTPMVLGAALIDGLMLTGGRAGGLRIVTGAHDVTVRNATLCGNGGDGITTSGDGVNVVNDMVCGNSSAGVSIRLRGGRRPTRLLNNTIVGNATQGIVVRQFPSRISRAQIYNNIVTDNGSVGIIVRSVRGVAPTTGNNLNTDGYGFGTAPGRGDLSVAPLFADGNPIETGCAATDKLYLAPGSAAINAGFGTAIEIGLGSRSVVPTGVPDTGPTDLGFHYPTLE